MNEDRALHLKMRQLFEPKLKEMAEMCSSCPFREGNDSEFGAICDRVSQAAGVKKRVSVETARSRIQADASVRGDFSCHSSAFTPDMKVKPLSEHLQCAGATAWFRTHLPGDCGPPFPNKIRGGTPSGVGRGSRTRRVAVPTKLQKGPITEQVDRPRTAMEAASGSRLTREAPRVEHTE